MAYSSTLTFETSSNPITITAESISFGFENPETIGSESGGTGAGKVTFSPFTFTKGIDASSPALYEACFSGGHFSSVILTIQPAGATSPIITYKFSLVFITQIMVSGNQHGGLTPTETIALEYGGIEYSLPGSNSGHGGSSSISGGWNQVTNTPTTGVNGIE